MKFYLVSFFFCLSGLYAQTPALEAAKAFQQALDSAYLNPEKSVLSEADFADFEGLEFYPLDEKYIVEATFVRTPDAAPFFMQTTTTRRPVYVKYGEAHFQIAHRNFVLSLYQQKNSDSKALFLPFTDLTNGDGSYAGGRYLNVPIPKGDTLVIDFNQAYNPYCVYNPRYSCPIPPLENDLQIRIEAGVKDFVK